MAEASPEKKRRTKRKFREAPTLRQQAEKNANRQDVKANKPSPVRRFFGLRIFAPVRFVFGAFGNVFRTLWGVPLFAPIRFVAKILGKIFFIGYFVNSFRELKGVTWPDFKTTWKLTFAVLVFGVIFGLAITGMDIVLEKAFREVLLGS